MSKAKSNSSERLLNAVARDRMVLSWLLLCVTEGLAKEVTLSRDLATATLRPGRRASGEREGKSSKSQGAHLVPWEESMEAVAAGIEWKG